MKRFAFGLVLATAVFVGLAVGQAPAGRGQRGPGGGGAPGGPGGGAAPGGPGGGGAGRGARGAAPAPATGPIADLVAKFVDAVNKADAAALQKMVTANAIIVDEDGHFDPIAMWITKLTTTGTKTLSVAGGRGLSPLQVSESGDTAWAAFNFNLKETVTPRGQTTATPNEINGTATMVFKKTGAEWQATLVHVAVIGRAFTPH